MSGVQNLILIGDPNKERFVWFHDLLSDKFAIESVRARTYEEILMIVKELPDKLAIGLVIIIDDFPVSISAPRKDPATILAKLETVLPEADFFCVITKDEVPNFDALTNRPHLIYLPVFPSSEDEERRVENQLATSDRLKSKMSASDLKRIALWDEHDRKLRRQIRSLSDDHELKLGLELLLLLIRNCLDCRKAKKIEIKSLGQGKSGASVFHLIVDSGKPKEYVIKLSDELWKLENEVRGHLAARNNTDLPGYKQHVAILQEPDVSIGQNQDEKRFIVNSGRWYAIYYDFLGGENFGKFIDLETALIADPQTLRKKTENTRPEFELNSSEADQVLAHRIKIFDTTLEGLCDIWYGKGELCTRKIKTIWDIGDAPARKFITLPPYQLTRRVKGWIQDFLDSREAIIGMRIFPDWESHRERVLRLVSDDSTANVLGRLAQNIPFTLSPVHGDLNVNNVLLWLKQEKYPFVIDLPFYQADGHVLQDFARLETEIKFALMDRQEESPSDLLNAFDNTVSQVPLWIEMEKLLSDDVAFDESKWIGAEFLEYDWQCKGYKENVMLSYKLIMSIRKKACQIQQKPFHRAPSPVSFETEYSPALLYHTIRSIGYPSLSVFKRLLSVYSAGLILEKNV